MDRRYGEGVFYGKGEDNSVKDCIKTTPPSIPADPCLSQDDGPSQDVPPIPSQARIMVPENAEKKNSGPLLET